MTIPAQPSRQVLAYPNPVADAFTVEFKEDEANIQGATDPFPSGYTIQLWSETQGLVLSTESKERVRRVSVQHLPQGAYYLHIVINGKIVHKQALIKNR